MVDRFEMMTSDSEQVVNGAVDAEKSLDLGRCFESTHLAFLLSGVLVGNFSSVVLVPAGSMGNGWKDFSVSRRIASKLVGNELPGWLPLVFQNLAKEAFDGSPVSVACHQDIEDVVVLVHRPPQIMTLTADGDEHFVHVPDVAEPALSPPQSTSIRWSKLSAPGSNGFVGYGDAALSEQILDIAKPQSEPMVQPDGMGDDLGWKAVVSIQLFHRSIVAHRR